jgi:HEPN domain-containing protein
MMSRHVDSYITLAGEDLAAAATLINTHPRHAAFNVEQAAEKLLKAVLTAEGIHFPTSHHQLGALAALLPPDHLWRADLMAFDEFTSYATAMRYPTPGGGLPSGPDDAELKSGFQQVAVLLDEIRGWCQERSAKPGGPRV